jgi:ATP-binding cassette, subfamily C, bacterial CydC
VGGVTATLGRLLALADAPRSRAALAAALGALTVIFGAGLMATAGYLISRASERPAILSLTVAIVGVRFFGLSRPLTRYLERLASHDLALRVLGRVRVRVYRDIEPLAPAQLVGYRHGDLLARMVADVDALQNLHLRAVGPPLVALLAGAVTVGVAAAFLPAAGLVLAAGLAAGGVAVPALAGWLGRRGGRRQAAARGELSAELVEVLRAAPELVAYGGAGEAQARLRAADGALVRLARRDALVGGLADGAGLAVVGATVAGVLAVAVHASADGHLDRTLIALLALLALASFEAVQPLAAAARELSVTLAAGGRVLELADREPAVVDPAAPLPAPSWPFAVALEDVRARYAPGERAALDRVSLRLEPGCRVALVGPSGAGKTTVVNLLLRFLDPEAGRVTLAGRDLREYRQEDVRRVIAVAGQDSHLFSASIRENVCLARPGASDADVEAALRQARLWSWVAGLPDGLDTAVGEEGRELSGGQRQRLVLARALLVDAPVLVLDEPTAHLDPPTARALVDDVFAAAGDRSVLLITHRAEGLDLVEEIIRIG